MNAAASLLYAFANVLHPRMLWLMVWPVLVAALAWGTVAIVFWAQMVLWLADALRRWLASATFFIHWDATDAAVLGAKILILLSIVPLIQLTALLILGVFGMQTMVEHVGSRSFPSLERKHGGSAAGSVLNSVIALVGLALLALVTLPLWIFPPLWPLIPVGVMGWVNQRVLRYDALAEHAEAAEMRRLVREERGTLYLLGFALALVAYVPVIGWLSPVVFGLAFIHYLLGRLQQLRHAASA